MLFIAGESVDFALVISLRANNHKVISVLETYSGITDAEVLRLSVDNDCVLITEDKDFGELTYRLNFEHKGILLIRLADIPRDQRVKLALTMIEKHGSELKENFTVLNPQGLRIKKYRK